MAEIGVLKKYFGETNKDISSIESDVVWAVWQHNLNVILQYLLN